MDGIGNVAAINDDDSISITTQGSQHMYKIPKSTIEGYNGAEVFLDLSADEMANYDINSKSQDNTEESTITTTAKSATGVSSITTTQTQISTMTEKRPESPITDLVSMLLR
jgi:cytoskeletal protein RodZ